MCYGKNLQYEAYSEIILCSLRRLGFNDGPIRGLMGDRRQEGEIDLLSNNNRTLIPAGKILPEIDVMVVDQILKMSKKQTEENG